MACEATWQITLLKVLQKATKETKSRPSLPSLPSVKSRRRNPILTKAQRLVRPRHNLTSLCASLFMACEAAWQITLLKVLQKQTKETKSRPSLPSLPSVKSRRRNPILTKARPLSDHVTVSPLSARRGSLADNSTESFTEGN